MTLTSYLGHVLHLSEAQAMRRADSDTGRLESLVDTIHAVVAFDSLPNLLVPLGSAPGTGCDAGFATDAEFRFYKYNSIFNPFLHGSRRARGYAPGIFAVEAGHENV